MGFLSFPIVLILAASAAGPQIPELVKPEVAVRQVAACGFARVRPRYDETLQEEVLEVADAGPATHEQLACAARASLSTDYYLVVPEALRAHYDAIYWRLAEKDDAAEARQWLSRRGMLARLPQYRRGEDDEAFARQIEAFCGERAKGALQSSYGPHALSPEWAERELARPELGGDSWRCLTNAASAAGFELFLIGNEAYQSPG